MPPLHPVAAIITAAALILTDIVVLHEMSSRLRRPPRRYPVTGAAHHRAHSGVDR